MAAWSASSEINRVRTKPHFRYSQVPLAEEPSRSAQWIRRRDPSVRNDVIRRTNAAPVRSTQKTKPLSHNNDHNTSGPESKALIGWRGPGEVMTI